MIYSDNHIHSEYSYDASATLETIAQNALSQKLKQIGITDHVNFNDPSFLNDLKNSAAGVSAAREKYPFMLLGVELTPIEKPEFDYIEKTGTREGYVAPTVGTPFEIALAVSKEELTALGVRYTIGASHWRVDVPNAKNLGEDFDACVKEWYRQQLWLACDERVTVLGHPWYHCTGIWYDDFSRIPRGMNMDIAAALKENGKYAECNVHFFSNHRATEKFRCQYAEFLRELFEMGIPITYGSDSHCGYDDSRSLAEKYLVSSGFKDGDISPIAEKNLW